MQDAQVREMPAKFHGFWAFEELVEKEELVYNAFFQSFFEKPNLLFCPKLLKCPKTMNFCMHLAKLSILHAKKIIFGKKIY